MPKRSRSPVENEAHVILESLGTIAEALARLVAIAEAAEGTKPLAAKRDRRRLRLSPKRRAQLKLQGRYIGYLRNLKPRQKAQVKALRVKKGYAAAIAMAKRISTR
jgi:hypothetical protein